MKKLTILLLGLFSSLSLLAGGADINIEKSSIEWTGKKVTGQHSGNISFSEGNLEFTDGLLSGGNFVVDMTSMTVTDIEGKMAEKLSGHLMSDDFFGVEEHETATLNFIEVAQSNGDTYEVSAELTIKGVTQPIVFDLNLGKANATASLIVDRTKYGIQYGSGSFFDNLGDKTIYDDFELNVNLAW